MVLSDIIILLIILFGGVIGFKRGFTNELLHFIGFFIVLSLAFLLKNPISVILYENLPFFKFGGILKGVTVLNIALYEIIAFFIVLSLLMILFRILLKVTSIFEKILKATIILGIPSKIAGGIIGIIESYVWVFILFYIFSFPIVDFAFVNESKIKDTVLNKTPILSSYASNTMEVVNEFTSIKQNYESKTDAKTFNLETLDLFLKYDIITVDSVDKLISKDKLKIDNIESVLSKYRTEEK